jgi:hypothetical protein
MLKQWYLTHHIGVNVNLGQKCKQNVRHATKPKLIVHVEKAKPIPNEVIFRIHFALPEARRIIDI